MTTHEQSWIEPDASLASDVATFRRRYANEVDPETGEMSPLHVLLIFGGASTEHLISCRSALNIYQSLLRSNHHVELLGITLNGEFLPYLADPSHLADGDWEQRARDAWMQNPERQSFGTGDRPFSAEEFFRYVCHGIRPDVIFPAVHGITCEDGVLQGLLELSGIPYVGSGVMASAIGMDKVMTKRLANSRGIPQLPWMAIDRNQFLQSPDAVLVQVQQEIGYPCFVKPNNGGSSLGTGLATDDASLTKALRNATRFDSCLLVEEFLAARELEVAVLGNHEPLVSDAGEIVKDEDVSYYDYQTKYFKGGSSLAIPAPVEGRLRQRLRDLARNVYELVGAAGLSRVDFFFDPVGEKLYFNEINTLPGFNQISLYPQAFERLGITQPQLVNYLLALALERHSLQTRSHLAEDDILA